MLSVKEKVFTFDFLLLIFVCNKKTNNKMKKKLIVSFLSLSFINTLHLVHSMDKAQLKRKSGVEKTKAGSSSSVNKENNNDLNSQFQKLVLNTPFVNSFKVSATQEEETKARTAQEEETKEDSSGQKTAHLANSVKQNNASVKSSNSVDQTTSLTATPDGWKKVIEDIMPKTAKTATSRALIGGTTFTQKTPEDLHKSLNTTIKTNEEIANKVEILLKSSLNGYYNDNYKNRLISKVKRILTRGFQVNMGFSPNIHEHQDGTKAVLHATVCNTCYKAEKTKCKSCNNRESYKDVPPLSGKIQVRADTNGKNGVTNILTINIENIKYKDLNNSLHIKLLQWIPKDLASALKETLREGNDTIDIKFEEKPVYTKNLQQTFNQNYGHNKRK